MRQLLGFITALLMSGSALAAINQKLELRHDNTRIVIKRNAEGDVQNIVIHTVDDSPLSIDTFLSTNAVRSIEMQLELTGPGHPFAPKRILALPSTGRPELSPPGEKSDWGRNIPYAIYSLDHVREQWLWPLNKGIPIIVEYENGKWGFLNITPPIRNDRVKVEYYSFETTVPNSLEDLLFYVRSEEAWPKPKLSGYQMLTPKEFRNHYLNEGSENFRKFQLAIKENPAFAGRYQELRNDFRNPRTDKQKLTETFAEMWTLADLDSNKNYQENIYPHFRTSHWAIMSLLNNVHEKNLPYLMRSFEDEILLTVKNAPQDLSSQFLVKLFNASEPTHPTRIFALNHFLSSRHLHHPQTRQDLDTLRQRLVFYFEFMPTSFFAELRNSQASDLAVQFLFDTYAFHTTPNIHSDSLALAWLMGLIAEGRDTYEMRSFISHFQKQKPEVFRDALDYGQKKKLFECGAIISRLAGR